MTFAHYFTRFDKGGKARVYGRTFGKGGVFKTSDHQVYEVRADGSLRNTSKVRGGKKARRRARKAKKEMP